LDPFTRLQRKANKKISKRQGIRNKEEEGGVKGVYM